MIKRRQRSLSVVHRSGDVNGSVRPMMPRGWFQATEEGEVHHDVRLDGYLNHTQGLNIQHKLNTGKEKKIGPYPVDGYDSGSNTVYQFHGSYWHGHDCWLTKNVKDQKWREGRQSRYDKTIKTSTLIQTQRYRLVEKWECQFCNDMRHQNLSGGGIYPAAMFPGFRLGDAHPDKAIIGETSKLHGNGSFGGTIMDQEKFQSVTYVPGKGRVMIEANKPQFKKMSTLLQEDEYF